VFTNCAPPGEGAAVEVAGGAVDTNITVNSAITGALGDEIDCTSGDGCVVALVRLESGGEVTALTSPLTFGAG
jgi:hypothetical protein